MARLSEQQALEICVLRSLEQAADNGGLWSVADAKEATREARDLTGPGASFSELLSRRAQWALRHMAQRSPDQAIRLQQPRWPALAAWVLFVMAFVAGGATDYLAARQQVDVVEYSLLGLIVWNLVIYLLVFVSVLRRAWPGGRQPPGLLDELIAKLRLRSAIVCRARPAPAWLAACQESWVGLSQGLNSARTKMVFHAAAICFAAGVVAVLYWRGLPTQYHPGVAGSTWLDLDLTQQIFRIVVTPGAWLFGLPVPDVQAVAHGRTGDNSLQLARTLFHLHAASVLVWVMLPRAGLVFINAVHRWWLRRAFALPLQAAYFTALRAAWRGQKIAVVIVPFRYETTPQVKATLQKMLARSYGMAVDVVVQPAVLMADDPKDWQRVLPTEGQIAVFAVFSVVATAEPHAHGTLLKQLRAAVEAGTPVVPIVDTSAFPPGQDERLRARQRQWRQALDKVGAQPLFLDLGRGDERDLAMFQRRLNRDE